MNDHNPETNFEVLWEAFNNRYPFFDVRGVDWAKQYRIYRPRISSQTSDEELFTLLSDMLAPLNDGHVELKARLGEKRKKRYFNPENPPKFYQAFSDNEIKRLFKISAKTLVANGFGKPQKTEAWILRHCRSHAFGYIRILELEDVKKRKLVAALDRIVDDFSDLKGFIFDIRDCPGGDDDTVITIINRFCDRRRIAFHRKTKTGPGENDFKPLRTWHIEPKGKCQFTGPIVLLTCDAVFSGGEVFALALRQLPYVTIIGDHTNGIFSYQLEKRLPNGWEYRLSYQIYYSPDMICYEGKGVPVDIELLNKKADLDDGVDPLIVRALDVLDAATKLT